VNEHDRLLYSDDAAGEAGYLGEKVVLLAGWAASCTWLIVARTTGDSFHAFRSPLPSGDSYPEKRARIREVEPLPARRRRGL
jgi:hypothetical protein